MNVIVSNKYQLLLENLGIDIIKEINGEFSVDEIISTFQNFFYQRMILDITAIKDYRNITNLQKLSISLNMDKVILLLDGTQDTTNPQFISQLVSMGIYNFARDIDGIQYLYNNPNSYRDVAQYHQINQQVQQPQARPQGVVQQPLQQPRQTAPIYAVPVPPITQVDQPVVSTPAFGNTIKVIGFKNVTKHAGATTLVYMLKNILSARRYKVAAIEVDKMDFVYFRDRSMESTVSPNFRSVLNKYNNYDVVLVDLNDSVTAEGLCQLVFYLIEPTTIKVNRLLTVNPSAFKNLKGKKVILNQCMLGKKDISEFEYEARIKSFYYLQPMNERDRNNQQLLDFLANLGFTI